jgi:futalosine hydrolase
MKDILVIAATELEAPAATPRGARVVVAGLGAVNTALALTRSIAAARPDLVVQIGVAGAYVPAGVRVGSVLLANEEMYGDVGVITPDGWLPADAIGIPLVPATGSSPARFNRFPFDAALVAAAERICGSLVARTGRFLTLAQCTGVRTIGDVLYSRFGALCESMEGAAAAQVCAIHGVPFLELRGVSNLVEDRNRAAWQLETAARGAEAALNRLLDRRDELA